MDRSTDAPTAPINVPGNGADQIVFATQFWDETEDLIKVAEQINSAMVVPAISELRYGGRKLVDYVTSLKSANQEAQHVHLADFVQCCVRARHDAVDAIVSYITLYLEELEHAIEADLIESSFPNYLETKKLLFDCANVIASSRKDRQERNKIYSIIKRERIDKLIENYRNLSCLRTNLFAAQRVRDKEQNRSSLILAGSLSFLAAAILAVALAFLS